MSNKCSFVVTEPKAMIIQLNSTNFYVFTPNPTDLYITCIKPNNEKYENKGFNIISLKPECRASMNHHIFTPRIAIKNDIGLKLKHAAQQV